MNGTLNGLQGAELPVAAAANGVELIVEHDTEYTYSTQVAFAQHIAHLTPLSAPGQWLREFALVIEPAPTLRHTGTDTFGNARTYFSLNVAHEGLRVQTRSRVRLAPRYEDLDARLSPPWENVRDALQYVAGAPFTPATEFVFSSAFVPYDTALRDYAQVSFGPRQTVLAGALDLMHRIHADFRYAAGSTDVATPVREAFAARAGVCQDFTHVMIGGLRALGLPARYVSGYLFTHPARADHADDASFAERSAIVAPGSHPSQSQSEPPSQAQPASQSQSQSQSQSAYEFPSGSQSQAASHPQSESQPQYHSRSAEAGLAPAPLVGADASHAWVSVYCPRFGWVELDPTNDMVPGTGHVRLAVGRDYGDVAPLRGVVQGGGEHHLRVAVRVVAAAPSATT